MASAKTSNSLIDLLRDALAPSKLPIYAENRYTKAPMYFGQTAEAKDPGAGFTIPSAAYLRQAFGADEAFKLISNMIRNGVNPIDAAGLVTKAPTNRGVIFVNPNQNDPSDTRTAIRHETIHNILDQAGLDTKQLTQFNHQRGVYPTAAPLIQAFNHSAHLGDQDAEIPAYAGSEPGSLPGVTPDQRDAYLNVLRNHLASIDPRAGAKLQSLISSSQ